jgi:hypothetical protein
MPWITEVNEHIFPLSDKGCDQFMKAAQTHHHFTSMKNLLQLIAHGHGLLMGSMVEHWNHV